MIKLEEEMIKAINGPYWPLPPGEGLDIAMHEAKAAAEVAKKYIEEACKQQREMCSHSLGYSSAVYIYPQDYDKMRDWISWTTLVNVDALAENGI